MELIQKIGITMMILAVSGMGIVAVNTIDQQDVYINMILDQNNNMTYEIWDLYNESRTQRAELIDYNQAFQRQNNQIKDYKDIIMYKDSIITQQKVDYTLKTGLILTPTLRQVTDFLREDRTDRNEWTRSYDCTEFSNEVVANARGQGLYGCIVAINIDTDNDGKVDSGHDIVVFNTSDAGLVYVEPQSDSLVELTVGMNYWCYFGDKCGTDIVLKWSSCYL